MAVSSSLKFGGDFDADLEDETSTAYILLASEVTTVVGLWYIYHHNQGHGQDFSRGTYVARRWATRRVYIQRYRGFILFKK